ncbi:MAG: endonuclease/exonuclease/phosphatase family protein [Pseudomonadota bacterium]
MRDPFDTCVPALTPAPAPWRAAARAEPASEAAHDALLHAPEAAGLHAIRQTGTASGGPDGPFTAIAWNIERGGDAAKLIDLMRTRDPAIVLLTEVDMGLARTDNRDITAEVGAALGMESVYAVEFLELGEGNERETTYAAGRQSTFGFHGNAVLSAYPIRKAFVIPLNDRGKWFVTAPDPLQRRVGGRNAIGAIVETPMGPLTLVSVHLESHTDAADRAAQMAIAYDGIAAAGGAHPIIIGGDLNTKNCSAATLEVAGFDAATDQEPLFADGAARGYDWKAQNTLERTTRPREWYKIIKPPRRLDWLLSRGLNASDPATMPAFGPDGHTISDHDGVVATFAFAPRLL